MQSIFGFIIHPMELGLIWISNSIGSAGIGIIAFTIFVRLILSPLNIAQLRNAKAMQKLQPHIAELRKKHGKDKPALSQATMALYKEHNVNPALGCLPTVLQIPILIGLFYALLHLGQSPTGYPQKPTYAGTTCGGHAIKGFTGWLQQCYSISGTSVSLNHIFDLFHAQFLWLSNGLGGHDPLYILPVLAGLTQWIQSRMMLTKSADPQQQMMNTMLNFMPLIIIFFALRYASGLALYWVTSTTIGILIQYRITGLGLLPETLGGLVRNLSGGGFLGGGSSGGGGGGSKPAPRTKPSAPPGSANPSSNGDAKPKGPTAELKLNGKGTGEADAQAAQAAARQRKRANRAKGGRGGRRG